MPTLFVEGSVVKAKWMDSSVNRIKPIDFLMSYLEPKVSPNRSTMAKGIKSYSDKVIILKSETGSGKSTIIPPYIYNKFYAFTHRNIAVTLPKVLPATEIPYQVITYNKEFVLGENIGYQTGVLTRKPVKGIIYMTIGVILQQLKILTDEEFMNKYSFIIIDEVHERDINTDLVLYILKQFLQRNYKNPLCPMLICMSATLDERVLMTYFDSPTRNYVEIKGLSYPITVNFAPYDVSNYRSYIVDKVQEIHQSRLNDIMTDNEEKSDKIAETKSDKIAETKGGKTDTSSTSNGNASEIRDILIFVQGSQEIKAINSDIDKYNIALHMYFTKLQATTMKGSGKVSGKISKEKKVKSLESFPESHHESTLKHEIPEKFVKYCLEKSIIPYVAPIMLMRETVLKGSIEYNQIYSPLSDIKIPIKLPSGTIMVKPVRRVITSTNVAEVGITINTLKYCIDSGWNKTNEYNPIYNSYMLLEKPATRAMVKQRKGRVGRLAPGEWFPCYTEQTFNSLQPLTYAQIIIENITTSILSLIVNECKTTIERAKKSDEDAFQMNQFDQNYYILEHKESFDIKNLDFIESPSSDSLQSSLEKLYLLGFIDVLYRPTLFGYYANRFRKIRVESIRMILAGYYYGANILDLITISAFIEANIGSKLFAKSYRPCNYLDIDEKSISIYYKYIVSDEPIEYLFIWYEFLGILQKNIKLISKSTTGSGESTTGSGESTNIDDDTIDSHFMEQMNRVSMNELYGGKPDDNERGKHDGSKPQVNDNTLMGKVRSYFESKKIKLETIYTVIELRDELIECMLVLGLNPYYNSLQLNRGTYNLINIMQNDINEGLDEINKIKHCFYEGYRMNLAMYSDVGKCYKTVMTNLKLSIDSTLLKPNHDDKGSRGERGDRGRGDRGDKQGKHGSAERESTEQTQLQREHVGNSSGLPRYILFGNIVLKKNFFGGYQFNASDISVLDNYVDVDLEFFNR